MNSVVGPVEQAVTSDGVSIAFQAIGQGPPMLVLPTPGFPLRYEEAAATKGGLRQKVHDSCSIVSWESPGIGLSDRSAVDFSMDAWVRHATAVAERLRPPVPVYAGTFSGPVAITLAAQRPDLVSHLVLVDTGVAGSDYCN
jgi:pimeloyl-ACP methyl ester carboxylesterase